MSPAIGERVAFATKGANRRIFEGAIIEIAEKCGTGNATISVSVIQEIDGLRIPRVYKIWPKQIL